MDWLPDYAGLLKTGIRNIADENRRGSWVMGYCEPPKSLLFCLDYDETFTQDKELWLSFIEMATGRGHSVICATMRYEHEGEEIIKDLDKHVERIIFTGRKAKRQFLNEAGYYPSVWIDDSPHWIETDSR